jgi:predicted DNA-binding protein YlxM (UPF0122 family)
MNEKIESMYKEGLSCRAIAKELDVSHTTVSRILRELGYSTNKKSNSKETEEMFLMYESGYSFEQVAKSFGLTRQAVWERLKRVGIKSREKKLLPFVMYDGMKWTINNCGYYRNTNRSSGEYLLHRYKYEREVGSIPLGYDIHHIDHDKQNNDISNLMLIEKSEHTKLHARERNENNNV